MAGRPVRRTQFAIIDQQADEDTIFAMLADPTMNVRELAKKLEVKEWAMHEWLRATPERSDRYAHACEERATNLAEEALQIADNCPPGGEMKARMQIDMRKWLAGKMDGKWSDAKNIGVNISIGQLHLDALRAIRIDDQQVIDVQVATKDDEASTGL